MFSCTQKSWPTAEGKVGYSSERAVSSRDASSRRIRCLAKSRGKCLRLRLSRIWLRALHIYSYGTGLWISAWEGKARWCSFRPKQYIGGFEGYGYGHGKWNWQVNIFVLLCELSSRFRIHVCIIVNNMVNAGKTKLLIISLTMLMSLTLEWKVPISVHDVCLGEGQQSYKYQQPNISYSNYRNLFHFRLCITGLPLFGICMQ